jgi:hypothetical protein
MEGNFSPVQIRASVSRDAGGPIGLISQHSDVTDTFILTVSKGAGDGFFIADISLVGWTNESQGKYSVQGGNASTTWPTSIAVGDPYGPATSNPQFSCTPANAACRLPFKIGVPQTFTITLAVSALVQVNPSRPDPGAIAVTTSAIFNGILLFQDASGKPLKVEARLDRMLLQA